MPWLGFAAFEGGLSLSPQSLEWVGIATSDSELLPQICPIDFVEHFPSHFPRL
jgi:hypothetical protein